MLQDPHSRRCGFAGFSVQNTAGALAKYEGPGHTMAVVPSTITLADGAIWAIVALATGGVLFRPWRLPEAIWAALGALALVFCSLLPWRDALRAVGKGTDVYLFLGGMMLLAELAREYGVFDWLAALAVRRARGSAPRLFLLVFGVGTLVTVLLSNDATAVVLTPAVFAAARTAKAKPLPYLFVCAFVANAASFVLPISNPANLVVFASHLPPLPAWLAQFTLPSAVAVGVTYAALRLTQRGSLRQPIQSSIEIPRLTTAGRWTVCGIALSAAALLLASAANIQLGLPTCGAAVLTACVVLLHEGQRPQRLLKNISWSVLPLVAGLFVLVEGLTHTGVIGWLSAELTAGAAVAPAVTRWTAATSVALACNVVNNLPAGLVVQSVLANATPAPVPITNALLIAIDLGPNLSITGSLATILWLIALRREGENVSAWTFLKLGMMVMVPALLLTLAVASA
jgi:arsenical pump membrane protein